MTVLAVDQAGFSYGGRWACRNISFQLALGEVVGLLGPNGAGKSTLLSMIGGLKQPREGQIRIMEQDPQVPRTRRHLGMTPQDSAFPRTVKVREVLRFVAAQYGVGEAHDLIDALNLKSLLQRQMAALSGGERRRVGLACALQAQPKLVVLDEPTTGLDLESRTQLFSYLRAQKNCAIVFSTHHFHEVEALAERVIVMHQGRLVRDGKLKAIKAEFGLTRVRFRSKQDLLVPEHWPSKVACGQHEVLAADAEGFLRWLVKSDADFHDIEVQPANLEEIFTHLVRSS